MERDNSHGGSAGGRSNGGNYYEFSSGSAYLTPSSSRSNSFLSLPQLNDNATASQYPSLATLTSPQAQHQANHQPRQPHAFSQVPLHASFYESSSQTLPPMVSIPPPPNLPPEPSWNSGFTPPVLNDVPDVRMSSPSVPTPFSVETTAAVDKRDSVSSTATAGEQSGAQPLRRNQACLSCRKRKLRCDAVRPVCGTCARSKAAAAASKQTAPVPAGDCTYDDDPPPTDAPDGIPNAHNLAATPAKSARKRRREAGLANPKPSKLQASPQPAHTATSMLHSAMKGPAEFQYPFPPRHSATRGSPGQAYSSPVESPTSAANSMHTTNVSALQNRIVELERMLVVAQDQARSASDAQKRQQAPRANVGAVPIYSMLSPSSGREEKLRVQYQQREMPAPSTGSTSKSDTSGEATDKAPASADGAPKELFDAEMGLHGIGIDIQGAPTAETTAALLNEPDPFLDLLWPGWPADLPTPYIVSTLARVFFEKHPMRHLIYKPMFMAGLSLPPRHPNRPHEALIHAIVACGASFSPFFQVDAEAPKDTWSIPMLGVAGEQKHSNGTFKDFHLAKARLKVERGLFQQNRNPLDWVQALLLCCWSLWQECRITEAFFVNALLARALAPSGLDKLQSLHKENCTTTGLFGLPLSPLAEHERRAALWWCYIVDQLNAGIPRYWEPLISDEMVQAELPIAMLDFQAGLDPPLPTQTLQSPDLFRNGHIDDFTLHIKSVILQKRVQMFCCRNHVSSNPGRKPHGLNQLNTCVDEFLASFPPSRFNGEVSVDRLVAHSNVHIALVYLHENFLSDTDDGDSSYSLQRVQQGTAGILFAVHDLMSSSFDFQLLHPSTFLNWGVAGRMLAKERDRLGRRTQDQDVARMQQVTDALDFLISALNRGAEKSIRARRIKELLLAVRANHLPETALADLLYLDTSIPLEDEYDAPSPNLQQGMLPDLSLVDPSALSPFDFFASPGVHQS